LKAAFLSGCQRFDGAYQGLWWLPMAEDELVGNLATETILTYLSNNNALPQLNQSEFAKALIMADSVFPKH